MDAKFYNPVILNIIFLDILQIVTSLFAIEALNFCQHFTSHRQAQYSYDDCICSFEDLEAMNQGIFIKKYPDGFKLLPG